LALAVAEFLLDDVFAFGDAIFMPGVFAFDGAGLLAVDLGFEAVPDIGLDAAVFLPAGLAVFLLAILLVDFAFGDTALPPAAFVVDLALVPGFACITPLFVVGALAVDCPGRDRIGHEAPSRLHFVQVKPWSFSLSSSSVCSFVGTIDT
jgi:hypothetical protein